MGDDLPADGFAITIDEEADAEGFLAAVEVANRVVEMTLRVLVVLGGQRVIDGGGPAFFLECGEDQLLRWSRASETLDDLVDEAELVEPGVVDGFEWGRRC